MTKDISKTCPLYLRVREWAPGKYGVHAMQHIRIGDYLTLRLRNSRAGRDRLASVKVVGNRVLTLNVLRDMTADISIVFCPYGPPDKGGGVLVRYVAPVGKFREGQQVVVKFDEESVLAVY